MGRERSKFLYHMVLLTLGGRISRVIDIALVRKAHAWRRSPRRLPTEDERDRIRGEMSTDKLKSLSDNRLHFSSREYEMTVHSRVKTHSQFTWTRTIGT